MTPPDTAIGHENLIARGFQMKNMKWFSFFLLVLISCSSFLSCDDAEVLVEPVIGSLESSEPVSRYTGVLHRVGDVERFGSGANDPVALEWDGTDLYMLAEQGFYPYEGQYLFKVDKDLGRAQKVNSGARDLGGSFAQGRTFTAVRHVRPNDLAWSSLSNKMFGVCFVIDMVVSIDTVSGLAGRLTSEKLSFCLEGDERRPQGLVLAHDDIDFYMLSWTENPLGDRIVMLSEVSNSFRCSTPIVEISGLGLDVSIPDSMCWDGEWMYVSERLTGSLSILDLETGELNLVARWIYDELPPDHFIQVMATGEDSGFTQMPVDYDGSGYQYVNKSENLGFKFPSIRGIAFDGQNMYAVDYHTDALYRVGQN